MVDSCNIEHKWFLKYSSERCFPNIYALIFTRSERKTPSEKVFWFAVIAIWFFEMNHVEPWYIFSNCFFIFYNSFREISCFVRTWVWSVHKSLVLIICMIIEKFEKSTESLCFFWIFLQRFKIEREFFIVFSFFIIDNNLILAVIHEAHCIWIKSIFVFCFEVYQLYKAFCMTRKTSSFTYTDNDIIIFNKHFCIIKSIIFEGKKVWSSLIHFFIKIKVFSRIEMGIWTKSALWKLYTKFTCSYIIIWTKMSSDDFSFFHTIKKYAYIN